ncbi:transcriptional regulator family: Fungal Specific TF [Penicillium paradoxum]|uniref:transcriptional regulator family: Fungal Specific TF n=1 Tax=Penicillium paradoxum TaxID=176176 RepID=UPI0025482012|nr:transcriptional regulator family: Fungal Specific TF [Penicillium paradoxum]KAJ5794559.1 transcriptional regulator family: Fungal Specific TF [Penicillium paradoxum]
MSMSPLRDHMQMHDSNPNQNQNQTSSTRSQPRLKFRSSCDPCAASKVRCTKEQNGCSRCVQNGLKCVYGRSRRKGKPPSNKNGSAQPHPGHSQLSPPLPLSPQAPASPPGVPAPSSSWVTAGGQPPDHHQSNYNFNCPWSRSPMFPTASYQTQTLDNAMTTEWERRTPNSLTPHQSLPDVNTAPQMPISSGYMPWPNLSGADPIVIDNGDFGSLPRKVVPQDHDHSDYEDTGDDDDDGDDNEEREEELDEVENANEDQHVPCITVACQVLSSLYKFVRHDCGNGHPGGTGGASTSRDLRKPPTPEEEPASDNVFHVTQSATETVSRLLNCTGSACVQDVSMLLILSAVLSKVLTWYQALYQSEIGSLVPSAPSLAQSCPNPVRPPLKSHHSNSSRTGDQLKQRQVDTTGDSMSAVPLTIPLSIVAFNISRTTETKMKAQLLLCELQNLYQVCQGFDRRVQDAESMRGGKNLCEGFNSQLLEKVGALQRVLIVVCTQAPK